VRNLRCEYKVDPLGIDVRNPRLSWELTSTEKGVLQSSYDVQVTTAKQRVVWETGTVSSGTSNELAYAGTALESGNTYYWRVRVGDNHGHLSEWSATAKWEMGLLEPKDWKAQWITPDLPEDENKSNPSPLLRREFVIKKKIERARFYSTAMGLYELYLNGKRVGDQYLTPGWTAYDFRYQYQTYDVTELVKSGSNCIGAILGDGWYRGVLLWEPRRNNYGKHLALLAQLVVTYQDGTQDVVRSDSQWKAATGPILASDIV
jgi:alpha-L-rhamnosidase